MRGDQGLSENHIAATGRWMTGSTGLSCHHMQDLPKGGLGALVPKAAGHKLTLVRSSRTWWTIQGAGFKKSVNRAGTTLMQKTGQIERTVDREFADEEGRYRQFEKETNALQKDSKAYLEAMRSMTAAQGRLANTIETFYGAADRGDGAMAGHAYKRAVDDLDASVTREFDGAYRTTVLEPVGKMCSFFPLINETITKRDKKLLDYDAARSRLRKLMDKPSEDPTKLPKAQQENDETKETFDLLNDMLRAELPLMLEERIPYFDPSFEAMIRMQVKFAEEGYEKLGGVQRYFADNVRDDYTTGQLDQQVESVLQEMRELSICGA